MTVYVALQSIHLKDCNKTQIHNKKLPCKVKRNIVFIKVHKCGSTTVSNIILRYAYRKELSVALPLPSQSVFLGWPYQFKKTDVYVPYHVSSHEENYNIISHHAIYNKNEMEALMPNDTVYFAILRDPFRNFVSAFQYYDIEKKLNMNKRYPHKSYEEFLRHPKKYEQLAIHLNVPLQTKNIMSFDLGLHLLKGVSLLQDRILFIDRNFKLILILEHLEESLVLMKRYFCWDLKDILYLHLNMGVKTPPPTVDQVNMHKNYSAKDYRLYDYFNQTLWKKIARESSDFNDEVIHFKSIQKQVQTFCSMGEQLNKRTLLLQKSSWHNEFEISLKDCLIMSLNDMDFANILRPIYKLFDIKYKDITRTYR